MLAASIFALSADCDSWLGTVCQTLHFEVALLPSSEGSQSALLTEGGGEGPLLNHTCCVGLYKGLVFLLSSSWFVWSFIYSMMKVSFKFGIIILHLHSQHGCQTCFYWCTLDSVLLIYFVWCVPLSVTGRATYRAEDTLGYKVLLLGLWADYPVNMVRNWAGVGIVVLVAWSILHRWNSLARLSV